MQISEILQSQELVLNKGKARVFAVTVFLALMIIGAYVRVPLPFTPVPITLQTLFVILGAAMLGRKFGSVTMLGYMGLGLAGLPVFQGYGSGLAHIMGPTGGYIIGFIAGSVVIGELFDVYRPAGFLRTAVFLLAGQLTIYVFGISWLCLILKIGPYAALMMGLVPFLPGAIFKLVLASLIYQKIGPKVRQAIS
ncbi:MAG: biotin transporter BioY [Candidatus Omnitrophota bacterium]